MNRREFSGTLLSLSGLPLLASANISNRIYFCRHATLAVVLNNVKFFVDPMLAQKDAMDPIANAGNDIRIPMRPCYPEMLGMIEGIDAILLTHTHRDHWDEAAQKRASKTKPIFCQPSDLAKIKSQGFTNVTAVGDKDEFYGVTIHRTSGRHGTGEIGQKMGVVSGYVLEQGDNRIYIAGDTIWCDEVEQTIKKFKPTFTIVNAGGAQFLTGGPITMTAEDVVKTAQSDPDMRVVAVHMDTINHCLVTRKMLADHIENLDVKSRISIPNDLEIIEF